MDKNKLFNFGKIDFLAKAKYLVPITVLVMVVGVADILIQGLNYGIDFSGGTEIQVMFNAEVGQDTLSDVVKSAGYEKFSVQAFTGSPEYLIRLESVTGATDLETNQKLQAMITGVSDAIKTKLGDKAPEIRRVDTVGPQVGDELKKNGILATLYSLIILLIYIGLRFDYKYAPGAVFCLFHDALVTLSILAILGREVNLQTMAAILTLIGYSLNDTIVIFDRIRENEKLFPDESFSKVVNRSINDTLSRTILTSTTTFLACATLYIVADGTIRDIAFVLGVGIILGVYSTIYIASPVVILFDKFEKRRHEARLRTARA